jgi:cytochrome c peroxidase
MKNLPRSFTGRNLFSAFLIVAAGAACATIAHASDEPNTEAPGIPLEVLDSLSTLPGDLGRLPAVVAPADNPQTAQKIELGRKLFFDKRFSADFSTSCASCHAPDKGFADGLPLAKGFGGKILGRHTPTVLNAAYNEPQFWDGRAHGLEEQAQGPIMAAGEMNMGTEKVVIERIKQSPEYVQAFKAIFNAEPSLKLVGSAIAAYERTVVTPNSPFDRYMDGDKSALTESQKRGLLLYIGKASCTQCHNGSNFTDNKFYSLGVSGAQKDADVGRFKVTNTEEDRFSFKTPTVRNAELTAPYMHDGSLATLEEVVEFYSKGGGEGGNKSKLLQPLNLSATEKTDLIAFIKSLTGKVEDTTRQADAETHSNDKP